MSRGIIPFPMKPNGYSLYIGNYIVVTAKVPVPTGVVFPAGTFSNDMEVEYELEQRTFTSEAATTTVLWLCSNGAWNEYAGLGLATRKLNNSTWWYLTYRAGESNGNLGMYDSVQTIKCIGSGNSVKYWRNGVLYAQYGAQATTNVVNHDVKFIQTGTQGVMDTYAIKYVKATSSTHAVHLVPCIKSGKSGVYDIVAGKFYEIPGTTVE